MTTPANPETPAVASAETRLSLGRWSAYWFWGVLALGVVVFSPAIRAPFWLDDYAQIAMVEGTYPAPRGPIDLYDFVREPERDMLVDRGLLPWWTDPHYKLRFFRPLSSSMLWAEHSLTYHGALAMHLVSFAWWVVALALLRTLLRRMFSERVVMISVFVYALAPCHALPLAWIANREVLVSLVFGLCGSLSLVRLADGTSRSTLLAATATLSFALALAGGEYGMCFGGFALAFAVVRSDLSLGKRAASLASFAVPAAAYLATRVALGYGTAGSGFYHDPLRSPLVFLAGAPRRFATLMVDAWTTIDFDEFAADVPWWGLAALFSIGVALVYRPIRATLRELDPTARKNAQWLLFGSMLSLVPLLAVAASARLIAAALVGVAPVIALVIDRAWYPADPSERAGRLRLVAALFAFFHCLHGPTWAFILTRGQHMAAVDFTERAHWLHERVGDTSEANVIIARAGWGSVLFAPLAIDAHGKPPKMWRTLVPSGHALMLRRDSRTIDLVIPHAAGFFPVTANDLFRDPAAPLHAGDVVDVTGMRVTVVDLGEVGPARLRFEFDRDANDPSLTWVIEFYDGYRDSPPPAIGFGKQLDAFTEH